MILHGDAACSVLCALPFILFVPHHSQMDPDPNIPLIVVYSLALSCFLKFHPFVAILVLVTHKFVFVQGYATIQRSAGCRLPTHFGAQLWWVAW